MEEKDKLFQTKWLKTLQQNSWEPEILISGIVLFGLFKIYPLFDDLNYFLEMNSSISFTRGTVNEVLTVILKTSNILLIIGFLFHLLLRSIWVAYIGLSYVYEDGISHKRLKYSDKYIKDLKKSGNYVKQINTLESICSVSFSVSFMVFMWLIGISFFFIIVASGIGIYLSFFPDLFNTNLFNNIVSTICVLVWIDFLSLGWFKRIPYLRKVYYPLHKIAGWLTLSFLYKNIYYTFASNHKRWKISLILVIFSISIISSVILNLTTPESYTFGRTIALVPFDGKERLQENLYRDKVNDGYYSKYMHIESYVTNKNYLELFIVHTTRWEDEFIKPACDYEVEREKKGVDLDSLRLSCLERFYDVKLNGELLEDDFIYQRNSKTKQDGLLSIIDISDLKKGKHTIDLIYNFHDQEEDTIHKNKVKELTFYKN
jgi:hypothetical protein